MYLVDRFHMSVGRVSEFIAWVAVRIVFANVWLVERSRSRLMPRKLVIVSALATGVLMAVIALPSSQASLWFTLGSTALALAVCLPRATMLSLAADDNEQGRAYWATTSQCRLARSRFPASSAEASPPPRSGCPCWCLPAPRSSAASLSPAYALGRRALLPHKALRHRSRLNDVSCRTAKSRCQIART